ncbi:MAG: hypothetical protein V4538_01745 [Bacteroidota bacterium]
MKKLNNTISLQGLGSGSITLGAIKIDTATIADIAQKYAEVTPFEDRIRLIEEDYDLATANAVRQYYMEYASKAGTPAKVSTGMPQFTTTYSSSPGVNNIGVQTNGSPVPITTQGSDESIAKSIYTQAKQNLALSDTDGWTALSKEVYKTYGAGISNAFWQAYQDELNLEAKYNGQMVTSMPQSTTTVITEIPDAQPQTADQVAAGSSNKLWLGILAVASLVGIGALVKNKGKKGLGCACNDDDKPKPTPTTLSGVKRKAKKTAKKSLALNM